VQAWAELPPALEQKLDVIAPQQALLLDLLNEPIGAIAIGAKLLIFSPQPGELLEHALVE
jgi:hypothetical protein